MVTDKLFELPWNNDRNLLDLIKNSKYRNKVKFFFLPCLREHGTTTRMYSFNEVDKETFIEDVRLIQSAGFEVCILIQRLIDFDSIKFYYDLGIKYFTVGESETARILRENYYHKVFISASITNQYNDLDYGHFSKYEPDLFDDFILKYQYARNITAVRNLPKNLKYGIMLNVFCLWHCTGALYHWFTANFMEDTEKLVYCYKSKRSEHLDDSIDMDTLPESKIVDGELWELSKPGKCYVNMSQVAFIQPKDLWLFDPYISVYKILDRTAATDIIFNYFEAYASADITPVIDDKDTENKYNIGNRGNCGVRE